MTTSAMHNQIEGAGARATVAVLEVMGGFSDPPTPTHGMSAKGCNPIYH